VGVGGTTNVTVMPSCFDSNFETTPQGLKTTLGPPAMMAILIFDLATVAKLWLY
jgi:hypothetical protein